MPHPVMPRLLVTGSGTDIGKTYASCLLLRGMVRRGSAVLPLKPVLSGYTPGPDSDIHRLLAAAGLTADEARIDACCPWRFAAPLAPPMAATREGRALSMAEIRRFCTEAATRHAGSLLLETAGGVMSPLGEDGTCLDLARALRWPVMFVGGSHLGAISHTLSGLEVLRAADVPVALVLISESESSGVPLEETRDAVQRHATLSVPILSLPRQPLDLAAQKADDMVHILAMAGFS